MSNYVMKERQLKLDDSWDVIVVGGGPAGCTAAAASAREGRKTLLIEATGALGGMGTSALVPAWCPFSDKEKIIYRGLAEKVFNSLKVQMPHVKPNDMDWVPIDAEALKRIYDDLVISSGAKVLFNTLLCDVDHDNNGNVDTIVVSNKAGLSAFKAKIYIDTTGDGDLAAWAGAEYELGNDQSGKDLQPATHCFTLTNVNENAYLSSPKLHAGRTKVHGGSKDSIIHEILASGDYPLIPDGHVVDTMVGPKTVGFNAGHIWEMNPADPFTITEGLILGRKLAYEFTKAFKEYSPKTFGNAHLVNTGSLLGIRESRRIIGDYVITIDDYAERRTHHDEIARSSYFIDVHSNDDAALATGKFAHLGKGESFGIPYRCLTPKGLNNVLVAGRNISAERMAHGSIRVMPVCLAMGEAAGVAASHALEQQTAIDVHKVDTDRLRGRLKELGAYFL